MTVATSGITQHRIVPQRIRVRRCQPRTCGSAGRRSFRYTLLALLAVATLCSAQTAITLPNGTSFITPIDLPPPFSVSHQKSGGRMLSAATAQVSLAGTTTDANGARPAQITIQAPGYMSYREGQGRAITFDGAKFQTKAGALTVDDQRVIESLLAYFPDSLFLQIATGGGLRRIGGHFQASGGNAYWTLFAFSPSKRGNLASGGALQQSIFIALDEQTAFINEVRIAINVSPSQQSVTQTQFKNWAQQNGQWFPSQIVRLENGAQVLRFDVQQVNVGAASPLSIFEP